jgi:hypothetical protein
VSEFLPSVRDDVITAVTFTAAKIEHEPLFADPGDEFIQARPFDRPIPENPGGDDDMRCPSIEVTLSIFGIDASAELQSTRVSSESIESGIFIAGAEHDDMATAEIILFIEFGKP